MEISEICRNFSDLFFFGTNHWNSCKFHWFPIKNVSRKKLSQSGSIFMLIWCHTRIHSCFGRMPSSDIFEATADWAFWRRRYYEWNFQCDLLHDVLHGDLMTSYIERLGTTWAFSILNQTPLWNVVGSVTAKKSVKMVILAENGKQNIWHSTVSYRQVPCRCDRKVYHYNSTSNW